MAIISNPNDIYHTRRLGIIKHLQRCKTSGVPLINRVLDALGFVSSNIPGDMGQEQQQKHGAMKKGTHQAG